jgi:hypothetical protein
MARRHPPFGASNDIDRFQCTESRWVNRFASHFPRWDKRSCLILFGEGLTTPPESPTAGLWRSSQVLAVKAFRASEPASRVGDLRSGTWAGSGDPRPTNAALGATIAVPTQNGMGPFDFSR